jgi:hypothetical protein
MRLPTTGQLGKRRIEESEVRKIFWDILVLSVVAFGILWMLDSTADAQCSGGSCPTQPAPSLDTGGWKAVKGNPAIVRVSVKESRGHSIGSGTIFRQKGKVAYVLTAAHVVKDRLPGQSVVVIVKGGAYWATVLVCDVTWDVAILRIADPKVKPLTLADEIPKPGDNIECSGFGPNGVYRYAQGPMTQFVAPSKDLPFEWIEVKVKSRQGDSGGPMVNAKGRIVGLINGTNNVITAGPCLPRIRRIVNGFFGCNPPVVAPPARVLPVNPPPRPPKKSLCRPPAIDRQTRINRADGTRGRQG